VSLQQVLWPGKRSGRWVAYTRRTHATKSTEATRTLCGLWIEKEAKRVPLDINGGIQCLKCRHTLSNMGKLKCW
jgi:hypothetical protein